MKKIEVTCPVCASNTLWVDEADNLKSVRVCHRCMCWCEIDDVEFGEDEKWDTPLNIPEVLEAWRESYAKRKHEQWLKNEGGPHTTYEGVDYHIYWSSTDYVCSHCGGLNDSTHKVLRVDIDGVPFCHECAQSTTKIVGYVVSEWDHEYGLNEIHPYDIGANTDLSTVINPPEEIMNAYNESRMLHAVFTAWAHKQVKRSVE